MIYILDVLNTFANTKCVVIDLYLFLHLTYKPYYHQVKKILVLDDSQTALFDINNKLQEINLDAEVFCVSNYDDAKKILESNPIDLAIVDLQMPEKNGADLIVHMKGEKKMNSIPIIVLTGSGEDSLLKTSLEPMVNHYLSKPVSQEHLEELLQELSDE